MRCTCAELGAWLASCVSCLAVVDHALLSLHACIQCRLLCQRARGAALPGLDGAAAQGAAAGDGEGPGVLRVQRCSARAACSLPHCTAAACMPRVSVVDPKTLTPPAPCVPPVHGRPAVLGAAALVLRRTVRLLGWRSCTWPWLAWSLQPASSLSCPLCGPGCNKLVKDARPQLAVSTGMNTAAHRGVAAKPLAVPSQGWST